MISAEARLHLEYSAWASFKLIDVVRAVPGEDFEKPVGVSHSNLSGTLAHILRADWLWYTREASEADINRPVENTSTLDGKVTRTPTWQTILHVVNHATLHRGQVMGMLRQMGIAPPHTDLMNYYRQLPA